MGKKAATKMTPETRENIVINTAIIMQTIFEAAVRNGATLTVVDASYSHGHNSIEQSPPQHGSFLHHATMTAQMLAGQVGEDPKTLGDEAAEMAKDAIDDAIQGLNLPTPAGA